MTELSATATGRPFSGWGATLGNGGGPTAHRRGPLRPQTDMPNWFAFAVPEGSLCLFDSATVPAPSHSLHARP